MSQAPSACDGNAWWLGNTCTRVCMRCLPTRRLPTGLHAILVSFPAYRVPHLTSSLRFKTREHISKLQIDDQSHRACFKNSSGAV